jgi:phospholipase C
MRVRRLFALSLSLAAVTAFGCSSQPSHEEDTEEALGDGDDVTAITPDEAALVEDDDGEEAEAYSAADPAYVARDRAIGPSAVLDDAIADAEDEDESADDEDGLPGVEEELAFPTRAADLMTAAIPTKIKYVMVLVKENHTFDNYFTGFPGATWTKNAKLDKDHVIRRPVAPNGQVGTPCHSNGCGFHAFANGAMDGFDQLHEGLTPFIRFTEKQIPNYWTYAREFVLADHMFSTTLGPSSPGHEVFWFGRSTTLDNAKCNKKGGCAGTGCSADRNVTVTAMNPLTCSTKTVRPCFDLPSLPDHLPRGFTWMDYGGPMAMQIKSVAVEPNHAQHFRKAGKLVADLKAGKLANLTIAHLSAGEVSEHPPANPCKGENFTVEIINAAMQLPQWNEMAIVVTWDDWGGFYDHVKPSVHRCANGKIFENGFRLPLLVISPYAKKGHILKHHTEQASVPRLVEELWGMKFMSTRNQHARDGIAGSLLGAFDFAQKPRPPMILTPRASCP